MTENKPKEVKSCWFDHRPRICKQAHMGNCPFEKKPKGALSALLLHVKNRPYIQPDNYAIKCQFCKDAFDSWVEELVGKTQELSLSIEGKERSLRKQIQKLLEDLEKKAKTHSTLTSERAKVWNKGNYKEDERLGQLLYVSLIDVLDMFSELRKAVFGEAFSQGQKGSGSQQK